jgi:hypothetical protein
MTVELRFPLEIIEGWPPVSIEGLPFERCAGGYLLKAPPLFVKGLSVGDTVAVEVIDGVVRGWNHLHRSKNSVIWLLRMAPQSGIDGVLNELRGLGCNTAELSEMGSYSIDVPEQISIGRVEKILEELDDTKVAIAYPSFRHA